MTTLHGELLIDLRRRWIACALRRWMRSRVAAGSRSMAGATRFDTPVNRTVAGRLAPRSAPEMVRERERRTGRRTHTRHYCAASARVLRRR